MRTIYYDELTDPIQVIIPDDGPLQPEVITFIKHISYYFNGEMNFAVLSENTAVPTRRGVMSQEEVFDEAMDAIREALSYMPDFQSYIMDDDCGIVELSNGGVLSWIPEEHVPGCIELPVDPAVSFRNISLDDCREAYDNGRVLALVLTEIEDE